MTHIPVTLLAYFLNATAVTIDKLMLTKHISNPLIYIFYFSAFSALALFLLPFAGVPTLEVFIIASTSTILWTIGAYFMFKGLQVGLVSRVIPIIGTLIPVFLLVESLINKTITQAEVIAVVVLIFGIVALTITDWKGQIKKSEIAFELLSAVFFAVSYIVLRQAYLQADFLTVLVWSRFIIIPISLIILIIPRLRQIIFSSHAGQPAFSLISKAGLLFLAAQTAGGLSELLLTFSISLASPALVNSLQGTQYIYLLVFALILSRKYPAVFKEKYTFLVIFSKIIGIALIGIGLYLLAFS